MAVTARQLRQRGHDPADIELAQVQQEASRRAGGPARTLAEILAGKQARPRPSAQPEDLTTRQLRRRGRYGQAALLADQEALTEHDPERARKAREASETLKALARKPVPSQFDFFGGNVSIGHDFHDAVRDRLKASEATPAQRTTAQAVLYEIIRHLGWQTFECQRTAAQIADQMGLNQMVVSEAIQRLESVAAITRIKRGRTKIIAVTPEGAYRGNVQNHAEALDRFKAQSDTPPLLRLVEG